MRRVLFTAAALCALPLTAAALALGPARPLSNSVSVAPLRVAVDISTAMPMSQLVHGEVRDGIHRDLALALARQLGATVQLIGLPRKRIAGVLEHGDADLSCHQLPAWLPGKLDWSAAFLPNATLLITSLRQAAPASVEALRGTPVGTVLGFVYPEVEQALGAGFVRDDAGDAMQNLSKLAAGRTGHALTNEVFFAYQQRLHPALLQVHRPMLVSRFEAQCAVAPRGRYPVARINEAIRALQQSGQLAAIYARYRPPTPL